MFTTGEPFSGPELAGVLASVEREGEAYLDSLSDTQFFTPQGAAWSPAQHVRHLRKAAAPVVTALRMPRWLLRLRFGRPADPFRSFGAVRQAYRDTLAAGGQAGRFAPAAEPLPASAGRRRAEIMVAWKATNASLVKGISRWPEPALDSACLPHPLMGRLSVREMLAFTVYHTAHHLTRVAERAAGGA